MLVVGQRRDMDGCASAVGLRSATYQSSRGNYTGIVVLIVAAEAELLLQCVSVTEGDPLPSGEVVVLG